MYMDLIVFGLIGLILSPSALGVSNKVQHFHSSGDGGLDIDTEGSGNPNKFETDDEDIVSEGSGTDGSGSGTFSKPVHETTTTPHTTRSLTPCEQLRLSVRNITGSSYVPKCTTSGEYEKLQCHKRMYNKECWCVDKLGNEITGSKMMQPNVPDCVNGKGLKPCVYQLLKKKQGLLGTYHPRCTIDGEFEKIQCHGSACWCVNDKGVEMLGSRAYKPEVPVCREPQTVTVKPEPKTTPKEIVIKWTDAPIRPVKTPKPDDNKHHHHHKDKNINKYLTPDDKDGDKKIDIVLPKDLDTEDPTVVNRDDDDVDLSGVAQRKESSDFFANIVSRPGILAAVIGGAVVGLLCAILLVMFIVYRMRKKDEGSYPLEEQKFTNYSYMKAPDKEFYA